jgi:succinate dehydrogenase / fumarate reductase cytochrome b subunit
MTEQARRPVHLDLFKIHLPVAGVMSIVHRITGVLMVLSIPVLLYLMDLSLRGDDGFGAAAQLLRGWLGQVFLFAILWALLHHLLAGVRYLLLDIDIGIEKPAYRQTAWGVLVTAPLLAALLIGGFR